MKLGTYVEVLNYVDDTKSAGEYYAKLGLNKIADDVYSDGRYHLRLIKGDGANPTLRYYGSDIVALKASGLAINDNKLTSPQGVQIELTSDAPPLKLPHDNVAVAPETTRLGKFGELSVFVDDLDVEGAFWESCGYRVLGYKYTDPMPWGIWLDDMYLIGIHQYGMVEPFSITYFHPDMKDINNTLVAEGFTLEAFMENPDDSSLEHATLMTPYNIKFYLFTGDISEANP